MYYKKKVGNLNFIVKIVIKLTNNLYSGETLKLILKNLLFYLHISI